MTAPAQPPTAACNSTSFDPLTQAAFVARLISDVTNEPVDEVLRRLKEEWRRPGRTVREEVRRHGLTPYVQTEAMEALYSKSDAFLYESAVWNRNELKRHMRRRVRRHLNRLCKHLGRDALDVLVIGDGPGFDSLALARAGHRVTYHELPGFQERFAVRLFEHCACAPGRVAIITDREHIPRGAFDAVVCLDVLEHVDDPPAVVRSLIAYMRPHGRLLTHAPFYMIHPAYPTHLRRNRRFSGSMRLYRDAGLRLIDGGVGWNPLLFARAEDATARSQLRASRRLAIRLAGLYFSLGRWAALPFAPIHWARRLHGRWFDS